MSCHGRIIADTNKEYTEYLIGTLVPLIYEGLQSIYVQACDIEMELQNSAKYTPNVDNPGVLKIFQICLKDVQKWNNHICEEETNRIKSACREGHLLDNLVKAVVKSYIVLLTYVSSD